MRKQAETEPQSTAKRLEQLLGIDKFPSSIKCPMNDHTLVEVAVLDRIGSAKYSKEGDNETLALSADYRLTPQSQLGLDDIARSLKKQLESCLKQYGQVHFVEKTNINVINENLLSEYNLNMSKLLSSSTGNETEARNEIGSYLHFNLRKEGGENGRLSILLNLSKEKAKRVLSSLDTVYQDHVRKEGVYPN